MTHEAIIAGSESLLALLLGVWGTGDVWGGCAGCVLGWSSIRIAASGMFPFYFLSQARAWMIYVLEFWVSGERLAKIVLKAEKKDIGNIGLCKFN